MIALGWRHDLERRDELHGSAVDFVRVGTYAAPASITHDWIPIEDQGQMGSCSGHAITTCQEVLAFIATNGLRQQFSRMFGYLAGQTMDGLLGRDAGATITGSVRGAKEMGCCDESLFPYPRQYVSSIPAEAKAKARERLIENHAVLRSYKDCFEWLASGQGAIEIGIMWTERMAGNTTGVLDVQDSYGQTLGGHALAIIGYEDDGGTFGSGRKSLIVVNSHGVRWGNKGRAKMTPLLIDRLIQSRDTEFIGIGGSLGLKPRQVPTWVGSGLKA